MKTTSKLMIMFLALSTVLSVAGVYANWKYATVDREYNDQVDSVLGYESLAWQSRTIQRFCELLAASANEPQNKEDPDYEQRHQDWAWGCELTHIAGQYCAAYPNLSKLSQEEIVRVLNSQTFSFKSYGQYAITATGGNRLNEMFGYPKNVKVGVCFFILQFTCQVDSFNIGSPHINFDQYRSLTFYTTGTDISAYPNDRNVIENETLIEVFKTEMMLDPASETWKISTSIRGTAPYCKDTNGMASFDVTKWVKI